MRILHLSDTHLTRAPGPNASGVDTRASLRRILDECREIPDLDAVVVTGDIADDGSREAYADARDIVGAFSRQRDIPVVFTTGNHDERTAFADVLGGPAVTVVAGWRIIALDSLVPGKGHGHISTAQLTWLREILAEPAPNGSVLAFHHPPIAVPGVGVQAALGLRNGGELAEVIRGTDVRIVLCGHFHLQLSGLLAGVPVWVTPGVVNRIDLTATPGTERAVKGASASLIDLGGPYSPVCHTLHARDPQLGETAYELGADQLAAVISELGPSCSLRYWHPDTGKETVLSAGSAADVQRVVDDLALPGVALWRAGSDTPANSLNIAVAEDGWAVIHTDEEFWQRISCGGPGQGFREVVLDESLEIPASAFIDRDRVLALVEHWLVSGELNGRVTFSDDLFG